VQTRQLNRQRAQATLEFALVAPLIFVCVGLLVSTTVMCLQFLSLHDSARTAARAAVVSQQPERAAQEAVADTSIRVQVSENLIAGTITVTATRTGGLWWLNRVLSSQSISQSVTMMREAPIVLG
jgi:Flp pilus assembly protein TadG